MFILHELDYGVQVYAVDVSKDISIHGFYWQDHLATKCEKIRKRNKIPLSPPNNARILYFELWKKILNRDSLASLHSILLFLN